MSSVPPEPGSRPLQPRLDPSGAWQWDPAQQQWVAAPPGQSQPAGPSYQPNQGAPHGYGRPVAAQGYPPPAQGYPAPAPGYAPPQGYPPGPGYAGPGGPAGAKPGSHRRAYIAAAVVVALAAAGIVVGVLAFGGGGSGKKTTPESIVKAYLTNLAEGDAKSALAQGAAPASATFLTDDILKQQQAKDKITNIKIGTTETSGDQAEVQATYQFGARSADESYRLTKSGGKWKLTNPAFQIDVSLLSDIPQVTLFGTPIANLSKVYVFPGPLVWGSQSKYFAITDKNADKFALSPYDGSASFTELSPTLNDDGKKAVQAAVSSAFTKCAASKMLSPTGCPQREYGLNDSSGIPKDGTVQWTAPTDLSGLQYYSSSSEPTKLNVSGTTTWKATYRSESFTTNQVTTVTDPEVKVSAFGTVDLGQTPPTYTPV
jgi:hypothetical protein